MSKCSTQTWKAFERAVAKDISMWLFGVSDAIIRAPCSGGWPNKRSEGDIVPSKDDYIKYYPLCADAKRRKYVNNKKEWHLEQLLTYEEHPILEWWSEMNDMLPVKKDGKLRFMVISKTCGTKKSLLVLGERELEFFTRVNCNLLKEIKAFKFLYHNEEYSEEVLITPFTSFMEKVDGDKIKQLWLSIKGSEDVA